METTPNPKCNRCKCYWKPDENDVKSSGLVCKTCKRCRGYKKMLHEKNKCEHNRIRSQCKDCGGGAICEHNRIRSQCKDCGGSAICEHNRIKSRCKDCGGGGICEHNRIRSQCKDCGGSAICEHNRKKSQCKDCGGGGICEHNRMKSTCKDCGGSQICEHNRQKSRCKDCGGSQICEHDRIKSTCKDCGGGSICEHNRMKSTCKDCGGGSICEHNRIKSRCKDCGGGSICEHNRRKSRCKDCDLKLYLVNLQRGQLWRCLNKSSLNKTRSSIEYLGCDVEYFIEYMKKKMDLWNETNEVKMNLGKVHIDHIKPVTAFNLDDENEFLDCCNYTNMQPLLAQDNLSKNNKWTDDDDIYWCNNIINKEYLNIYIN